MIRKPTEIVPPNLLVEASPLAVLRLCQGYYDCPKDETGKRLGPLMGYAGKYKDLATGEEKQFVGDVYYNFSQAEQYPHVLAWYAEQVDRKLNENGFSDFDCILGAPMGGIALAQALAARRNCLFVFAEKKEVAPSTAGGRATSKLILNRHVIEKGMRVLLGEDVCNNYSTTDETGTLVASRGATLAGIICAFNRSGHWQRKGIPVFSPAFLPTQQYQQDDPAVAKDIAAGNVLWKPKDEWAKVREMLAVGDWLIPGQ